MFGGIERFIGCAKQAGVIAFSSGNHAQAIALAAKILGIKATIVMPADAPANKLAATRGYGAVVVLYDRYNEDREAIGNRIGQQISVTLEGRVPFSSRALVESEKKTEGEMMKPIGTALL